MSRPMSSGGNRRQAASPAASRRTAASPAASGRSGRARDTPNMRGSRSEPRLKSQLEQMKASGTANSQVLGTMAGSLGAKIASTLHHRGEHDVGAIVDPNDDHVYVPRAMWTQSHDHPLKANNAQWNQQHYVADELKRLHGEAKKKEYMKRSVDDQLRERSDNRTRMINEKQEYAQLVNDDANRHQQDENRRKAEAKMGYNMLHSGLSQQQADLSRRAHESRAREAQEAAEMKMRTVQQMCEEMAEQGRKKRQLKQDCEQGMRNNEAKRVRDRVDKAGTEEKARQEMRQQLMQDEYKQQAISAQLNDKQANEDARMAMYERTAGACDRHRDTHEVNRQDNDEKKHLLRTDAYYSQRERARERQRQGMVHELDRQMAAVNQKRDQLRLNQQMDREAIQSASKRSLDAEMAKASAKRMEEQQLQQELRVMMVEKEEREAKEGITKPTAMSTMNLVMRKNGNVTNELAGLQRSVEAARYCTKPLGRTENSGRVAPLDASAKEIRRLTKDKSFQGQIPIDTILGGVVGTLGGGGGGINCALMATGGPYKPKSIGIAIQDRKLASTWYEGIRPEHIEAGRQEARRRETAKREVNHD